MTHHRDDLARWHDDPVVRALVAPASTDELEGIGPVLAEFRQVAARPSRGRLIGHIGTGVTMVAAALAVTGGVAAAYTRTLPEPLQSAMHTLLGPIGVPATGTPPYDGRHAVDRAATQHRPPAPRTRPGPSGVAGSQSPSRSGPAATAGASDVVARGSSTPSASVTAGATGSASPTPTPAPAAATLSAAAARTHVPYQQRAVVRGVLATKSGAPVGNHRVYLAVRAAGSQTWQRVAGGRTDDNGRITLRSGQLGHNVVVRLVTPQGLRSSSIAIIVVPKVSVTLTKTADGKHYAVRIVVAGAQEGDTVRLARHQDGSWSAVAHKQLDSQGRARFTVSIPAGQVRYRVRVLATARHGDGYATFTASP